MFNIFRKKIPKHNPPESRKQRSENKLADFGIVYPKDLPNTIERDTVNIRSSVEIARKIIALWEVVNIAYKPSKAARKEAVQMLHDFEVWEALSKQDQDFLQQSKHSPQVIIDRKWRTEVLNVLYWTLGEVRDLGKPIEDQSVYDVSDLMVQKYPGVDEFIKGVKLRPKSEILDEADFMYRLHWCAKDHRRKKQRVPSSYNLSVIRERDFALRWVTNPYEDWDDISLDT